MVMVRGLASSFHVCILVPQMFGQLGVQGSLNPQFGQLLAQAILANKVFRLLVVGQQAG